MTTLLKLFDAKPVEYVATALIIVSALLTSFNIYPLNLWTATIGGIIWVMISWAWARYSLVVLNIALLAIYLAGFAWSIYHPSPTINCI